MYRLFLITVQTIKKYTQYKLFMRKTQKRRRTVCAKRTARIIKTAAPFTKSIRTHIDNVQAVFPGLYWDVQVGGASQSIIIARRGHDRDAQWPWLAILVFFCVCIDACASLICWLICTSCTRQVAFDTQIYRVLNEWDPRRSPVTFGRDIGFFMECWTGFLKKIWEKRSSFFHVMSSLLFGWYADYMTLRFCGR